MAEIEEGQREVSKELKEFYDNLKQQDDSVKSVSKVNDFVVDENNKGKFSLGDVYFVTKEIEGPDGNMMPVYELYNCKTNEMIGETDLQNRLHLDKQYDDIIKQYDFDANKQLVEMIDKEKAKDDLDTKVAVVNGIDKGIDKDRKQIDNKPNEKIEDENEKELNEDEIMEKSEQEGKKISSLKIVDDPTFYQFTVGATVKTYFATYEDGSIGCINGRGEDIFEEQGRSDSVENIYVDDPNTNNNQKEQARPDAAFKTGTDKLTLAVKNEKMYIIDKSDEDMKSHPIEMAEQRTDSREKNLQEYEINDEGDQQKKLLVARVQKYFGTEISDQDAENIADMLIENEQTDLSTLDNRDIENAKDEAAERGLLDDEPDRGERGNKPSPKSDE